MASKTGWRLFAIVFNGSVSAKASLFLKPPSSSHLPPSKPTWKTLDLCMQIAQNGPISTRNRNTRMSIPSRQYSTQMNVCLISITSGQSLTGCADKDATDYFRGVVLSGEKSSRVLDLTEHIIRQNPAHYSAWYVQNQNVVISY